MEGDFKDNNLIIKKYVDKNTIIEKKDPDQMVGSTFKLGRNKLDQENSKNLELPHFKDAELK